jgi:hypothetical protein
MSCATRSMPAMSRPTTRAASTAACATSGWTWSVQSLAMLPLRWIVTTRPAAGTAAPSSSWRLSSSCSLASVASTIRSSGYSSSAPRRGSLLSCFSISSATLDLPSPVTVMISPRAAATTSPPTTRRRCSWPRMKRSTITSLPSGSATAKAAMTSSRVVSSSDTPRPWLASEGFTTTGRPMSSAASQASSALATIWPSGTGTPQLASRDLVSSLSLAIDSPMALV